MILKNNEVELLKKLQEQLQDGNVRLERDRDTGKVKIISTDERLSPDDDMVQSLEEALNKKLGEIPEDTTIIGDGDIDVSTAVTVLVNEINQDRPEASSR